MLSIVFASVYLSACSPELTEPKVNPAPDTTSHNFSWKFDTLGIALSWLSDVAVIKESDVWAVGWIHTDETDKYDSLGNWVKPYNAAHWDGKRWELKRIYWPSYDGKNGPYVRKIKSVFVLSEKEVLFFTGGQFSIWNGSRHRIWTIPYEVTKLSMREIWGRSTSDIFFLGSRGTIVHWDGTGYTGYTKIETNMDDIDFNSVTEGPGGILYCAGDNSTTGATALISIKNLSAKTIVYSKIPRWIKTDSISGATYLVWSSGDSVFVIGDDYWWTSAYPPKPAYRRLPFHYSPRFGYPQDIDGTAYNNVFIVGHYCTIWHFNGKSLYLMPFYGQNIVLYGVAAYKNTVFCVGSTTTGLPVIITGNRQ